MGSSSETLNSPMDSARDTNTAHRSEPEEEPFWPFGPLLRHINRWFTPRTLQTTLQPLTDAAQAGRPYYATEEQDPPALLLLARAVALLRRAGLSSEAKVWRRFGFSIWDEVCHQLLREAQEAYADVPQESDVDHADWLLYEVQKVCRGAERRLWHAAWDEYLLVRRSRADRPPTPPRTTTLTLASARHAGWKPK